MDDIIRAVATELPEYNRFLLKDFTEQQVASSIEFVSVIFSEAIKQFDGQIVYDGYRILLPEERVKFELEKGKSKDKGVRIAISELILVAYRFIYSEKVYNVHLYMPYVKDDVITVKNTRYVAQRTIVERLFTRTNNGISAKVIRSPIRFDRSKNFQIISAVDPNSYAHDWIITASIHNKEGVNKGKLIHTTVLHYLLCKFGYVNTLHRFGFEEEDFRFTQSIGNDTNEYDYFVAKKKSKQMDVYLRVRREMLANPIALKFVANLLYILTAFDRHSIIDLYVPTGDVFRVMMGKITYGTDISEAQHKSHADTHILSLNTYLDPVTKQRLQRNIQNVRFDDIYDLLQYIFIELQTIMVNSTHTDLYTKRIDIIHNILINTIGRPIFKNFYNARRDQKKLTEKDVAGNLYFNPMLIANIWRSKQVVSDNSAYCDNWLASFGIGKTRQSGLSNVQLTQHAPEHRFHPSIPIVETLVSFSGKHPGMTGAINPFLEITSDGDIIKPEDLAKAIDPLYRYL